MLPPTDTNFFSKQKHAELFNHAPHLKRIWIEVKRALLFSVKIITRPKCFSFKIDVTTRSKFFTTVSKRFL